ncbi:hypothetical protein V6N12_069275 [Hibiscus sabdariffa]|uniref:Uncharacterized protein n=1 Tax=Hibiscus sabdariffa TaxID=183260 RepID=A0ABR2FDI3_9ROSI
MPLVIAKAKIVMEIENGTIMLGEEPDWETFILTHKLVSNDILYSGSDRDVFILYAIDLELTFYIASKDAGESQVLSNKLLHGQLDAFGRLVFHTIHRLVMKGDTVEMTANALGLTMESNGINILEPFDTSIKYSNSSGKTNIHLSVSDIFMNFSFSILRLFLAAEEDILAFLSTTSKEMTVDCSQFDRVGTIKNPNNDQIYAFWRARAPVGFAVLGDYLTPMDKPPTKGILAVDINHLRVKRPVSFKQIWPPIDSRGISNEGGVKFNILSNGEEEINCSVWFPEAPEGYVAVGCVVSPGKLEPSSSSAFCIPASFVAPCSLRDCITITNQSPSSLAFWRVDSSLGTFLPAEPTTLRLLVVSAMSSQKVHQLYEPPNTCTVFHDMEDGELFKAPLEFQLVGQIKKQRGMDNISFWLPQAPPGYVALGCVACKGPPKQHDFCTLRCMRSDMVTRDKFLEESVLDTSYDEFGTEPFSIWVVANELGTFVVRGGTRKPPRRFALKLADPCLHSASDDTVLDAEIGTFSVALFDDFSGLMVPLVNISLSGIAFSLHGRCGYSNSTASFSLAARSYNDKYESWEPIVEPVDGVLR